MGLGFVVLSKILWIVGTAVYQFALCEIKSFQNELAEKRAGTTTEPPEWSGARKAASSP
jgi:hypothetical protein